MSTDKVTPDSLATPAGEVAAAAQAAARDVNLDVILDVPVTLSLEVGRTQSADPQPAAAEPGIGGWNSNAPPANRWTCS